MAGVNQTWPPHAHAHTGSLEGYVFLIPGAAGRAVLGMPQPLLKASNINSIENLLTSYHLKC